MTNNTYTLAMRQNTGLHFELIEGIPQNMPRAQAMELASKARDISGLDVVAFNMEAER